MSSTIVVVLHIKYYRLTLIIMGEYCLFVYYLGETNAMEADEEEEFAAEKKKNLQILGSLLNIDLEQSKTTKMTINAKKFKYVLLVLPVNFT